MEINPEELYNNVIRVLHDAIDGELTHRIAEKSQILSLDASLCLIGLLIIFIRSFSRACFSRKHSLSWCKYAERHIHHFR